MSLDSAAAPPAEDIPVQAKIEAAMDTFHEGDRWEAILLFSSEGLPLASHGAIGAYGEEDLMQFAFSLIGAVRLLGESVPTKEIVLTGREGHLLSFHYFSAWGEEVVLAVVATKKRGYRRAVARLIQFIQGIP